MRLKIAILLNLIFIPLLALADEQLPMLKVGSDVYLYVTVTKVTATDIYFTSDKGMGNAKLKNLDPALQKHFHYDATKAQAAEQQQKPPHKDVTGRLPDSADPKTVMNGEMLKHPQDHPQAATPNAPTGTAPSRSPNIGSLLTLPAPALSFLSAHMQAEVIVLAALILLLAAACYVNGRHSEL